ncbi:MAG TPA: glycosyltransferase family A protein [Chitinophagaceae bacterium]|jgi:alpha-1,3-rhamnosyltransferase|nr:glycosyltransferase family A protein [Chitinophagaceae bacterium]
MNIKVSVCVLSWNHEKYIEQCIQSIIDQSFQEFEFIFLDNASTDATYEKAVALLEKLTVPTIILRNERPKKISENLNLLYAKARGKYITSFSGDDWWATNNLEVKVAYYEAHPEIGLLYGSGWIYYDDAGTYEEVNTSKFMSGYVFDDLINGNFIFAIGFMTKADVMKKIGKWNESIQIEDWDMWLRIAKEYPIDYILTPTAYYRRHSSNVSSVGNKEYYDDLMRILSPYKDHKGYKKSQKKLVELAIYHEVKYYPTPSSFQVILKHFRLQPFYFKQLLKLFFSPLRRISES